MGGGTGTGPSPGNPLVESKRFEGGLTFLTQKLDVGMMTCMPPSLLRQLEACGGPSPG